MGVRTRAKFKVDQINMVSSQVPKEIDGKIVYAPGEVRSIIMSPVGGVYDNDKKQYIFDAENTKFWLSSPSGRFELGCANLDAVKDFQLGKSYYIDITEAE